MSGNVRDEVSEAAQRLLALAARVAELRQRLRPPAPGPAAPLFSASAAGDTGAEDVELHFQIDDAEEGR